MLGFQAHAGISEGPTSHHKEGRVEKELRTTGVASPGGPSRLWGATCTLQLPLRDPEDQPHLPLCCACGGKARLKPSRRPVLLSALWLGRQPPSPGNERHSFLVGGAFHGLVQVLLLALAFAHPPLKMRVVGARPAHSPGTPAFPESFLVGP